MLKINQIIAGPLKKLEIANILSLKNLSAKALKGTVSPV
jgi:hypothetical protein